MRILIHSNAPWVPSGYGKQCSHLVRTLSALGHDVTVSAFCGLTGAPIEYQGITVLPSGQYEYGIDVLVQHIQAVEADLTITLMDGWKLGPIIEPLKSFNVAAWVPADCTPLSRLDKSFLEESGVKPIAMSRFGQSVLKEAGFNAPYAPHVVDRALFSPLSPKQRKDYREGMGLDDKFLIGLCAANNDSTRKGFPEQFEAFRRFHKLHPDAMLLVHSIPRAARGLDLQRLALELGLDPASVRFTDTYAQVSGAFDDSFMADWFGVLDVLSSCSYAEAFGVPMLEAQACGTPVISTAGSAMDEMRGHGFVVQGEPFWNHVHGAWWTRPRVTSIVRAYGKAWDLAEQRRGDARTFSEEYDRQMTGELHWKSIVEDLCA